MNPIMPNLVSADQCHKALVKFWNNNFVLEESKSGYVMALPLMYPDGWQVVVRLEPVAKHTAFLTDRGETLAKLFENGVNYNPQAKATYQILEERKRTFDLIQDGFELKKQIPLPLEGVDIQLFAESLVSIAHLVYREEPKKIQTKTVYKTIKEVFSDRKLKPRTNVYLNGKVEKDIKVEFLLDSKKPLAIHCIDITGKVFDHVERWAWRWTDIQKKNPRLVKAMVYNPDQQDWDQTSLNIGDEVCDLFCPYYETKNIHAVIDRLRMSMN